MKTVGKPHRSRSLGVTVCLAAVLAAGGSAAAAASSASTPAKDTFHGSITKATGKLANDRGTVTILMHVAQSTDAVRPVALGISGPTCGRAQHCLRLTGTLSGTISAHPTTIPDAGKRYSLSATGSLAKLGRASATGLVAGVGFIRVGREGLTLELRTRLGDVTVSAVSPKVPAFTSP